MSEDIFPPITLEAGRPQWTPRDKLARLVLVSRVVGYFSDMGLCPPDELAEERALFVELAGLLEEGKAEKERADLLAEALHGSYGTAHFRKLGCEAAIAERDAAIRERDELNESWAASDRDREDALDPR